MQKSDGDMQCSFRLSGEAVYGCLHGAWEEAAEEVSSDTPYERTGRGEMLSCSVIVQQLLLLQVNVRGRARVRCWKLCEQDGKRCGKVRAG